MKVSLLQSRFRVCSKKNLMPQRAMVLPVRENFLTLTRTSRKKLYYYRCLGSDDYRYPNGRVCHNRPVRQDYLDEIVWKEVLRLLEDPELIRNEIERRLKEIQQSNPTKRKKDVLSKEIVRIRKAIEKLLDAYQEDLLQLDELRQRMPELRKREKALHAELQSLEAAAVDQRTFLRLAGTMESFLARLRRTAETLDVQERQKVLRLVVKEVLVDRETIRIKHSIPVTEGNGPQSKLSPASSAPGYLLRSWSH